MHEDLVENHRKHRHPYTVPRNYNHSAPKGRGEEKTGNSLKACTLSLDHTTANNPCLKTVESKDPHSRLSSDFWHVFWHVHVPTLTYMQTHTQTHVHYISVKLHRTLHRSKRLSNHPQKANQVHPPFYLLVQTLSQWSSWWGHIGGHRPVTMDTAYTKGK